MLPHDNSVLDYALLRLSKDYTSISVPSKVLGGFSPFNFFTILKLCSGQSTSDLPANYPKKCVSGEFQKI